MITLITGVPGVGKTLYAAHLLTTRKQLQNRPLFAYGVICSFRFPEYSPFNFSQPLPDNAVVFIDGACNCLGNRSHTDNIKIIKNLNDRNIDILLTEQHHTLIHKDVRSLLGEHFNLVKQEHFLETVVCLYRYPQQSPDYQVLDIQNLLSSFVEIAS